MAEHAEPPVSRATSPDEGLGSGRRAFLVALGPEQVELPEACACCAAPSTASRVLRRSGAPPLVVPYCAECHARFGRLRTRTLSFAVAGCLLAMTFAGALPVLFDSLSFAGYACAVALGSLVPAALYVVLALRPVAAHAKKDPCRAEAPAAFWTARQELVCRNEEFASAVAARHRAAWRASRAPVAGPSAWLALAPVLALASAWILYPMHFPVLRVVNLSPVELSIYVDGEPFGVVQPTSAESSRAGLRTRVPAGARTLEARTPAGDALEHLRVHFEAGQSHLFAPASQGYCFWLESTRYGRAPGPASPLAALDPELPFWVLRQPIDSWFAPNPVPGAADERSTGGVLTALRQGRCAEVPPALAPDFTKAGAASE